MSLKLWICKTAKEIDLQVVFAVVSFGSLVLTVNVVLLVRSSLTRV